MKNKICIVDDEPELTEVVEEFLRPSFSTQSFQSPILALEAMAKDADYGILVTDIKMPEMDGIQLVERIQRSRPDISTIIISGFANKDHAIKAISNGATGFLEKPFQLEALHQLIAKTLSHQELIELNRIILKKYEDLARLLFELNQTFFNRCARVENLCLEKGIDIVSTIEQKAKFREQVSIETKLARQIEELENELIQLVTRRNERRVSV